MSYELIGILALGVMMLLDMAGLVAIGVLVYRNERWGDAYDAAILRRVEEIARKVG